ncbi:TPA: alpha/beta fold hydrolase [Burkholderia cenocepacia]|uniref:Hydrolase n=1 Tax=Burkholderia arboris TaxID=488730 RepID=A0A9Q9SEQ5_9BURK|nr:MULTISPECIES: alpha/beta hydrolase [Burkholderia cepacia complex]MCW3686853.1 alpha/beta hydrolase [Burkholderia cenocepacia]QUN38893.1 alpha/beta fold hydrolase [Burkholderia cenocepacia]QUO29203.1 alpha/beta fold hydrolase [Burkholderia cenocepacia]VWB28685.1 hydrolase [Burkholderia arboris]
MYGTFSGSYSDFSFSSDRDGEMICARRWSPPANMMPRGLIQITHGISEHSGRYDQFAHELSCHGYVVYALDLRAHGRTARDGKLGIAGIDAWELMKSDIAQIGKIAKRAYPNLPLIAFGHSMGSALTQIYAQEHGDSLAGVILCGTMGSFPGKSSTDVDTMLPDLKRLAESDKAHEISGFMEEMLESFNSSFVGGSSTTGGEWMTGDKVELNKFFDDPLCGKIFCNSLLYSVADGFQSIWREGAEQRIPRSLPILIICGTEDPVGEKTRSVTKLIDRYAKQGHLRLSYIFYPGARHEILNEVCRDVVFRDIEGWLALTLR